MPTRCLARHGSAGAGISPDALSHCTSLARIQRTCPSRGLEDGMHGPARRWLCPTARLADRQGHHGIRNARMQEASAISWPWWGLGRGLRRGPPKHGSAGWNRIPRPCASAASRLYPWPAEEATGTGKAGRRPGAVPCSPGAWCDRCLPALPGASTVLGIVLWARSGGWPTFIMGNPWLE